MTSVNGADEEGRRGRLGRPVLESDLRPADPEHERRSLGGACRPRLWHEHGASLAYRSQGDAGPLSASKRESSTISSARNSIAMFIPAI